MSRSTLRTGLIALLVGALSVSVAWAGAGLAPVRDALDGPAGEPEGDAAGAVADDAGAGPAVPPDAGTVAGGDDADDDAATTSAASGDAGLLAGAARVDLRPRPEDYGGTWETEGCATLGDDAGPETATHVPEFEQSNWPAKPGCLYMGGYGIGPMNPITAWDDEHGLHVRSVALSDGEETVVLTLIDAVYYLGRYGDMCDGCGSLTIAERLGDELGIDPAGMFIAATHSHTSPDLIGGWGGVPGWYMQQVEDAIEDSIRGAVDSLQPAVLEIGEELARPYNSERRDTYRSAEEPSLSWLRAVAAEDDDDSDDEDSDDEDSEDGDHRSGRDEPPSTPPGRDGGTDRDSPPEVIATVGAYAAHPVTRSAGAGVAHGDWPAVFARDLEQRDGGVAMAMATGLGNISPRRLGDHGGADLAGELPGPGAGTRVAAPDIDVAAQRWNQPVTNPGLTALAAPGFFDRPFDAGPAQVSVGTHEARPCTSASPVSVRTQVSAARIGPLLLTGAPGETFSNLSNTIREHNPTGVTVPLGMTNDGLGYIVQSFEADGLARTGLGFFAGDLGFEYEDAYAIDGCFGDKVLEETLGLLARLGE